MNSTIRLSLSAGLFAAALQADTFTWDGGGTDNNWQTDTNWVGDAKPAADGTATLAFSGATRTTTINDFADDTVFAGISLPNDCSSGKTADFTLSGSRFTLGGNIVTTLPAVDGTITDTISADMLFNGTRTLTVNLSGSKKHNLIVSGVIGETGGSQGLTKSGNGDLTLSSTNTYSGKTTISSGRLYFSSLKNVGEGPSSFGAPVTAANGIIDVNGRITYTGGSATSDRVFHFLSGQQFDNTGSGTLTLTGGFTGSGTTPTFRGNGTFVVSGLIALGSGGINRTDGGTVYLTNPANAFTGSLTILDGTFSVDTLADAGTACPIGAGSTIIIGQGNGTTGKLRVTGAADVSCNRAVTIASMAGKTNGGNIENATAGTTLTLSGNISPSSAALTPKLQLLGTGDGVLSGVISGAMLVTINGTGIWTLSGANTYTGVTTVSSGTLLVNGSTAAGSTMSVASGATLGGTGTVYGAVNMAAGATLAPGSGGIGTLTAGDGGSAALTLNGNVVTCEVSNVSGTCDAVTVSGTLVLNGDSTLALSFPAGSAPAGTYTLMTYGAKTGSGTLVFDQSYPNVTLEVGETAVTLTVTGGGTASALTWAGDDSANVWNTTAANWSPVNYGDHAIVIFDDTGSSSPAVDITPGPVAPYSVTVNTSSKAYTFGGEAITGTCSIVKSGTAALTLNGANAYSGLTAVNAGSLTLNGTLSNSCVAVAWGATLTQNASGRIDGEAVSVTNRGTMTLSGTNTYGGMTVVGVSGISNITLTANSPYALGSTAGGTLVYGGSGSTESKLLIGGGVTITGETLTLSPNNNYRAALRYNSGGTGTWAGDIVLANISGPSYIGNDNGSGTLVVGGSDADTISGTSGSLSFRGWGIVEVNSRFSLGSMWINRDDSGTLIINSTNNVFGGMNLVQGTLKLGISDAFPAAASLSIGKYSTVNNQALFDLNGKNQTLTSLAELHYAGGGGLQRIFSAMPATLTISNSAAKIFGTEGSSIEGAVSLVKLGTSSLTLTGANSYSGTTVVSNGTLAVSATGMLGTNSLSVVVDGNGTLALSNSSAIPDTAVVAMPANGVSTAKITLDEGVNETVSWLYYGTWIKQAGTHGSNASTAQYKDDTHFAGPGVLTVLHGHSGTVFSLR